MNNIVRIRPLELSDTNLICKWHNAEHVKDFLFGQQSISPKEHELYYQNNILTKKIYQFIIECLDSGVAIGSVFLKNIDKQNKEAEVGIFIGEKHLYGRGYGSNAIQLISEFAFDFLKLHKLYALALEYNKASIRAFEKTGFVEEKILKDYYCRDSSYYNVVQMALIDDGADK